MLWLSYSRQLWFILSWTTELKFSRRAKNKSSLAGFSELCVPGLRSEAIQVVSPPWLTSTMPAPWY